MYFSLESCFRCFQFINQFRHLFLVGAEKLNLHTHKKSAHFGDFYDELSNPNKLSNRANSQVTPGPRHSRLQVGACSSPLGSRGLSDSPRGCAPAGAGGERPPGAAPRGAGPGGLCPGLHSQTDGLILGLQNLALRWNKTAIFRNTPLQKIKPQSKF